MILPKIVLDAVQTEVRLYDFIINIMFAGAAFTAFTLANMFFHNEIAKISQTFLYRRLNALWEKKGRISGFIPCFLCFEKLLIW